jgi:hypothetical protein
MIRATCTCGIPFLYIFFKYLSDFPAFQVILQTGIQENLNGAVPRMGGLRGRYGRC